MWTKQEYGKDDDHVDFKEPRSKHKYKVNNTTIIKTDLFTLEAKL
jgi:hypothetical protein